ncbi:MAG: hypothetical protein DIJKHBIC_00824 [Thermoanaerobaculia bacterium]|nr:hypothetical protein [Thermoanaerobaculia bacterium]
MIHEFRRPVPEDSSGIPDQPSRDLPGLFTRFLIQLSGVPPEFVVPSRLEQRRYMHVGMGVLLNTLLAFVSCFYVAFLVSKSVYSYYIALGWAAIVWNIDTSLVTSMIASKVSAWRASLLVIRLAISLLLSVMVAEPLGLLVFRDAIRQQKEETAQRIEREESRAHQADAASRRKSMEDEIYRLRMESTEHEDTLRRAEKALTDEIDAVAGSGLRGHGSSAAEKKLIKVRQEQRLRAVLQKNEPRIAEIQRELEASQGDLVRKAEASGRSYLGKRDITIELQALNELSARSTVVAVARILFSLLLIFVELFPILYKLQLGRTLADELAVHHEAAVRARLKLPPSID